MKSVNIIVIAAGLLFTTSVKAQTKITVSNGQKFKVESAVQLNTSAEVMGQSMETTADTKSTTMYEVKNAGAREIDLQSVLTNININSSSMGQEMSFNSDDKESSGPIADMLKPKIGKAVNLTIDNQGKIIKQDVSDEEGQLSMMGVSGGPSASTDLFIPALIGITIKEGDETPSLLTIAKDKYNSKDSGTYKVTKIENGIANISYTGTQAISATIEQMGMEMQTTSSNTVQSELQMDIRTGLVLAKATVITMNVSVDAGGMTIPATGKTVTTTKITPLQ